MAVGMMFQALQYAAKKSGYLLLHTDDGKYAVVDTVNEEIISFEDNLDEVADLLGGLAVYTAEQRRHHDCKEMVDVFDENACRKVDEKYIRF